MSVVQLRSILIVDDDRFMRMTIRAIAASLGHFAFEEAGDGADALDKLAMFRPDVVLCDIGMAPMGGLAFVEALRAQPDATLRSTPVIMLTADATEATVVTAGRLQVHGYLLKPVSPKRMAEVFRSVFETNEGAASGA